MHLIVCLHMQVGESSRPWVPSTSIAIHRSIAINVWKEMWKITKINKTKRKEIEIKNSVSQSSSFL